jgi:hypothetical protein
VSVTIKIEMQVDLPEGGGEFAGALIKVLAVSTTLENQGTTWRIRSEAKIKEGDWVGIHDEKFQSESLEQVAARCGALMDGFIDGLSGEVQTAASKAVAPKSE